MLTGQDATISLATVHRFDLCVVDVAASAFRTAHRTIVNFLFVCCKNTSLLCGTVHQIILTVPTRFRHKCDEAVIEIFTE